MSNNGIKIEVRSDNCLYVEMNGWYYYIDDSTNEQIVESWLIEDIEEIEGE